MTRRTASILALILFASALLGTSVLTRGHFWGDDFAAYIGQAKSILHDEMDSFVARNDYTVTQSSRGHGQQMGPAAYPWGFPLILAPVYALIGLSPLALKLPGLIMYLGFLLSLFFLTRRRFTTSESLLAVSLFAFNPGLLLFLDNIISDIPFLCLSTLAILLADEYTHTTGSKRRLALAALTGTAIFAAFFVRTQGLILLGSALLFQGIRFLGQRETRRQIVIDSAVMTAIFVVLWGISSLIFPGGQGSYLTLYEDFKINTLTGNIASYSRLFSEFFAPLPGYEFFFNVFVVLFFIGLVVRFKEDILFVLYAFLYLLVVWTWPAWQGYRFLFPVLPFFIYFAIQGIRATVAKAAARQKELFRNGAYAYLALIVAFFAFYAGWNGIVNLRAGRDINGPFDPFSIETYSFIKDNTPPESVIIFFKPRALRLMTDRDALAITECERIPEGDYLALSKKVGENLQIPPEQIGECNLSLDKVFENRRFVVFKVLE